MKPGRLLVLLIALTSAGLYVWPAQRTSQESASGIALAQSLLPTATPHMTWVLPSSATSPFYSKKDLLPDGPGQTRVISIPSLHPRCQSLFTNVRPMHALVDQVAHLKIWNDSGELIFNKDLNLYLGGTELHSPDCTSQTGYDLLSGPGHMYEVKVHYECCFSCYQTATPPPGTMTPPAP